jgi:hypothetical protein
MLAMLPAVTPTPEVTPRVVSRLVNGDGSGCTISKDRNRYPVGAEGTGMS